MNRTTIVTLNIRHGLVPGPSATDADLRPGRVRIRNGLIDSVTAEEGRSHGAWLDAAGCTVLPGFVDVHVHGGAGRDVMDGTPEALLAMARLAVQHGVTGFLATTMTAQIDATVAAVEAVARLDPAQNPGARILGVHLEGPFISPVYPGAQHPRFILAADTIPFRRLVDAGPVAMITLAPEIPGGQALIQEARRRGIVVVMGHTDATYDQVRQAVEWGVVQATHTYNAMSGLHHRRPGVLGGVLSDDRIYAQLIADNIHVHPAAMKILARCKGVQRTLLISDAMRATGMPDGEYELGGQPVFLRDGECRLADGTLAGSVLTLERALANFMAAAELPLSQAWPVTSLTPATTLGLSHEMGRIAPGYRADLVLLDSHLSVVATLVGGEVAYLRPGEEGRLQRPPG